MQPGIRQRLRAQYKSLRNLHPEKTASEKDSLSGYPSGRSRQSDPGIRKTGAVKPRVTSITDLEDDRDQNLQEWEGSVPENDVNDDDRRKRKGIFRMLITAGILVVLIGGILAVRTIRKPVDNGEPRIQIPMILML